MQTAFPSSPRPVAARCGRVSHACVACQQKKQRCDGQTPSCRNCLRANRTCISQDPSTKRTHPRGYMESLEQHIAFLEGTIQELRPDIDIDRLTSLTAMDYSMERSIASRNAKRERQGTVEEISSSPDKSDVDGATGNDTTPTSDLSGLGLLYLRSAGGEPHYFGSSSAIAFSRMFSASLRAVRTQGPGLTMSGITDASVQKRSLPAPMALPDASLTSMLCNTYFDQVHPQFPFLHRPTFMQWLDEVTSTEATFTASSTSNPARLFFIYAVAAVGALIGPASSKRIHEGLYASAESLLEVVMQLNSLESIQAILCCAMYSIRSPVGVSVWMLSGLALRHCIELGLHRKIPWSKAGSDTLGSEMRKRVFWCAYNLDRAAAVTLGRPVGISNSVVNVEYPLDINDENITVSGLLCEPRNNNKNEPSTTVSTAIHTIRIRQIWARMQDHLDQPSDIHSQYRTIDRGAMTEAFKRQLSEWLESSPPQRPANQLYNNNFGSSEWFEIMYHHSILLLYRHRLAQSSAMQHGVIESNDTTVATVSDPVAQLSASSSSNTTGNNVPVSVYLECAEASQSICRLYRTLYVTQRLNDTWGSLHVLFLGGVTFLHCLWVSEDVRNRHRQDKVAATCIDCMVVLAVMSERWNAVEPFRDAFDLLSSATQSMMAERATNSAVAAAVAASLSTSSLPSSLPAQLPLPTMPALTATADDPLSDYLSHMADIGLCPSIEALLADMIN